MAVFVREAVSHNHFKLLQELYGRDLGGERFLHWKHLLDPHCGAPMEKTGIFYKDQERYLGMFVSSFYPFKINELSFNVNMLGDLGIHRQVKSSTVLKDFFLQARRSNVAADICFSDDRKIRVYEKIFRKYLTTNTQIYPFVELTLKPDKFMAFRFTEGGQARQASFINNLGREKDHRAFEYIEKHPLYHKIHYINKGNLYAVIGCSSECAELLDISNPSRECFSWAIGVCRHLHSRCKVMIPIGFYQSICAQAAEVIAEKRINMLIGYYSEKISELMPKEVWVCRMDRR
ncbi:hypothetical protein SME22J_25390 [Serratia marcescens]|nr:hypothetical protein SME22J_25390 [Serratia marcescens]BEO43108.1 hypothetical protein SMQE13_24590 [Serratia marcescens]